MFIFILLPGFLWISWTKHSNICFHPAIQQKHRNNADPDWEMREDTAAASDFDKLLENQNDTEEDNREDAIKAAVAAVTSAGGKGSTKKKTVRAKSIAAFKVTNISTKVI